MTLLCLSLFSYASAGPTATASTESASTESASTESAPAQPLLSMDASLFHVSELEDAEHHKTPAGTVQQQPGRFGPALQLNVTARQSGAFITTRARPTPAWKQADGFSFWVKGDGSQNFGGIELIDPDDFSLRYGYCFPIDSTEWKQIDVRWSDLLPEQNGPLVGTATGQYPPDRFGNFWFGKWFYWRDFPAYSCSIDHVMLEPTIARGAFGTASAEVVMPASQSAALNRVKAKLAKHQPITIVTMGDSLSDKHHWSNRETLWSELLCKQLHDRFESEVKLINPAIGGTTLSQNAILIPRWLAEAPTPDLVTIWFGGNDWESNVHGERFAEYLAVTIDRVRALTHNSADVLVMTTEPQFERWETLSPLEQAAKDVARDKHAALVDIAARFRQAGSNAEAMKHGYWASDRVHLGKAGHALVADSVEATLGATAAP